MRWLADGLMVSRSTVGCQLWRTDGPPERLWPVEVPGSALAISPDGSWLATTHRSGVALHPLDAATLMEHAQRLAGRALTRDEKADYLRSPTDTANDAETDTSNSIRNDIGRER